MDAANTCNGRRHHGSCVELEGAIDLQSANSMNGIHDPLFNGNAIELSDLYFEMQNYNYEAKRIRYATEEANLHPTSTDTSHISKLKGIFYDKTKPNLLNHLRDYEKRIITLRVKSANINVVTHDVGGIHTDANGNVKSKY